MGHPIFCCRSRAPRQGPKSQTELVLLPSGCSSKFQFRLFTKPHKTQPVSQVEAIDLERVANLAGANPPGIDPVDEGVSSTQPTARPPLSCARDILFRGVMSNEYNYDHGLHSHQPKENFQSGSPEWEGARDAERIRARDAEWARQRISDQGATSAPVATGSGGPGSVVALEAGILSGVALYRNWPQYLSLYSSFPRISVLWERGIAAGLVLLSVIFYVQFCSTSKLFTWGSFIIIGAFLAEWSLPWGLHLRTCLAGFLLFMMFFDRLALRS